VAIARQGAPDAFHLLTKPTGAVCNLDCSYCFFLSKEMLYPGSRFRMADELLEAYIEQLIEAHSQVPEVQIAWQGGEPTLMGLDFFRRSVELAEAHLRPGQRAAYTIQTNGTLLDPEWAAFFRRYNFFIGVSLDGPEEFHNHYRRSVDGENGFRRTMHWTRGVDAALFRPRDVRLFGDGPVFLYVGRVAVEKNIETFLRLDLPGKKVVVGGGPMLAALRARYPRAIFTGKKLGEELAECYASADVFVFPTIQDGFGMVLAQAAASGLPVLTTPHSAGADLVHEGRTGWILPARDPSAFAERLAWCAANREGLCAVVEHAYSRFRPRSWDDVAADFTALCERTLAVAS